MKQQVIFFILAVIHLSAWSQASITTDVPCTDAMTQNAKGRWIKSPDVGTMNAKEVYSRVDEIQNMILKIYPQPTGVDAVWHRSAGTSYFGAKKGLRSAYNSLPHFISYVYTAGFFRYRCEYNKTNSLIPGSPGETGTWVTITANKTEGPGGGGGDLWTINGLPVRMRPPVLKSTRGFEIQYPEPGSNTRYVLIHRQGILPYIPVTRKQYLDQCIINNSKIFDDMITAQEQMPLRTLEEQEKEKNAKLAKFEKDFGSDPKRLRSTVDHYLSGYQTDQQQREESIKKIKKIKENEIKKFRDELEKTTGAGLLDSPAVVLVMYYPGPIFETDPLKGHMLVTENPAYIRKELPKHVSQVFAVWWTFDNWTPQERINEIMEQDFPFEKLQAMIDK
jgi:hypothetical protein